MKILIVEDNSEMRRVLNSYIRPLCRTVYECADGCEAFEFYRRYKPDWVLMDWQMEKMDGIAATEQIVKKYPDAHICMVTSFDDEDLKKEAVKAGACNFVLKDDLLSLRRILAAH